MIPHLRQRWAQAVESPKNILSTWGFQWRQKRDSVLSQGERRYKYTNDYAHGAFNPDIRRGKLDLVVSRRLPANAFSEQRHQTRIANIHYALNHVDLLAQTPLPHYDTRIAVASLGIGAGTLAAVIGGVLAVRSALER